MFSKFLIWVGFFCRNDRIMAARVAAPHKSTKGDIAGLDPSYFAALTEQDSVSNLRYGILFLLALSSLGVYSIILAG